jgi:hypothetical protein
VPFTNYPQLANEPIRAAANEKAEQGLKAIEESKPATSTGAKEVAFQRAMQRDSGDFMSGVRTEGPFTVTVALIILPSTRQ